MFLSAVPRLVFRVINDPSMNAEPDELLLLRLPPSAACCWLSDTESLGSFPTCGLECLRRNSSLEIWFLTWNYIFSTWMSLFIYFTSTMWDFGQINKDWTSPTHRCAHLYRFVDGQWNYGRCRTIRPSGDPCVFGAGPLLGGRIWTEWGRELEGCRHHGSAVWLKGQHGLCDLSQSPEQRWTRTLQPCFQLHNQETTWVHTQESLVKTLSRLYGLWGQFCRNHSGQVQRLFLIRSLPFILDFRLKILNPRCWV